MSLKHSHRSMNAIHSSDGIVFTHCMSLGCATSGNLQLIGVHGSSKARKVYAGGHLQLFVTSFRGHGHATRPNGINFVWVTCIHYFIDCVIGFIRFGLILYDSKNSKDLR